MNALARQARYAVRNLRKNPSFAISVALAMAVGIGIGAPVLGIVRAALLRPVPYTHPLLRAGGEATDWFPNWTAARQTIPGIQHEALQPLLWILFALTLLLLTIALINILTLLLARAAARRPEVALRSVLGAVRRRLMGHLLLEGAPLFLLGGGLATAIGVAVAYTLHASWPGGPPPWGNLEVDGRVLAWTLGIFVLVPLLAWLSPAGVAWRRDLRRFLTTGARSTTGRGEVFTRQALAVVQVASLIVLLTSAGLLLRGFASAEGDSRQLGFDPRDTLTVQVRFPEPQGSDSGEGQALHGKVRDRIAALPGVVDTSVSTPGAWLGLGTTDRVTAVCAECYIGTLPRKINRGPARISAVSPGLFDALGASVLRGRELDPNDGVDSANVAVINHTFAYRLFPNGEPLGKQIQIGGKDGEWYTVVAVVDDIRARGIGSGAEPVPGLYLSALQHPPSVVNLAVRTSDDPMRYLPTVEKVIHALAPEATLAHAMTMEQYLDRFRAPLRWFAVLLGVLAGVALLFATSGLHSVMSYNVTRRTREIGIRMAVGARAKDITRMVLGQSLRITIMGVMLGLFGALPLARLLQLLLRGVEPFDPLLFG
ncbi:MAG: ABC transporter permease, partial [Chloroflexota bacterium]|nr:ABC transporter permease [Chloroflexota bacterium]